MDLGIKDRLALITGASRNIGRSIALELGREGARLVLVARTSEALEAVKREAGGPAGRHHALALDLMAPDGVQKLAAALEKIGQPEIIVHNMGGSAGVTNTFSPSEEWHKVWRYNVGVAHEINRLFIPAMTKKRWGRIVYLSTLATRTHHGYPAYVSAKCAMDGYIGAVNREVSKDNVILSALAPGAVYLEGRHFSKIKREDPAAFQDYLKNHVPIGRLIDADELAPIAAFLCSEKASYMAGAIVPVDGGGS